MGHEGVSWGIHGLGPIHCAQTGIGPPVCSDLPEAQEGPDVRESSNFHRFGSGREVQDIRRGSVVGGLGDIGRPVLVGRAVAVACVGLVSLGWRDLQGPDVRAGSVVRWL